MLSAIALCREAFEALDAKEQTALSAEGRLSAQANLFGRALGRRYRCPACNSFGAQWGQRIRASDPIAEEDTILIRTVVLPTRFRCYACGLRLNNHARLHFAGLGDQFTVNDYIEPTEFYGLYQPEAEDWDEYFNE